MSLVINSKISKKRPPICLECIELWQTYTKRQQGAIRKYGINTINLDFSKCNICGFVYLVDIHHIDFNKKNNELTNLVCLCPNCHMLIHHKHMSIDNIRLLYTNC